MYYRPFLFHERMIYDRQILEILTEVGERGISVRALAKHVCNKNRTFFSAPELSDVHQYVQQYLLKNSKSPQSLIESTGRRGYYRLNTGNSADARQLMIDFRGEDSQQTEEPKKEDLSLDLFADL